MGGPTRTCCGRPSMPRTKSVTEKRQRPLPKGLFRMWFRATILFCASLLPLGPSNAQDFNSANHLLPGCRLILSFGEGRRPTLDDDMAKASECAAIVKALRYVSHYFPAQISACPPTQVTNGQMFRAVIAYIDARPRRMHEDFRELVIEALHQAWPCPPS